VEGQRPRATILPEFAISIPGGLPSDKVHEVSSPASGASGAPVSRIPARKFTQ
jgi:hypothetical protein